MKLSYNSPVVLTFVLISASEITAKIFLPGLIDPYFISPAHFNVLSPGCWIGSVLYVFGHTSFNHFAGNMMFILLLGPALEEKYGSKKIAWMIFFTAVLTACINATFMDSLLVGASGIVFMMIVLTSFASTRPGTIPLTSVIVIGLYLGREFFALATPDNISHFAHIVGGVVGGTFGTLFARYRE